MSTTSLLVPYNKMILKGKKKEIVNFTLEVYSTTFASIAGDKIKT